ncbi:Cyanophycin synthetase [Acaryochloris thomasi RCC1774]|uniref:Cyanophycin synthetase n=1 Tax=Acaryochloris thomasi RCC1774 TaxID=1764569 RepID=A0A2W1JW78_9CYAN|nr:cyanophycin synthetase [Acaryochloris thomasi]PZD72687.1 Cyanophycin synthetase [Acaryochloris thomasi RCC1774]
MKILQTQTLRGPNYWSVSCSKLIVVLLDLEDVSDGPSNTLPGFLDGLTQTLPSLKQKLYAPEYRGASLDQELQGSMMGHILKHVALELQVLADMPVAFGCTCETASPDAYQVAIEYQNEDAGRYATRAALRLCQSILDKGVYPKSELQIDLDDLRNLRSEAAQGASTEALIQEAENRGIPWTHLETCDLFQFGSGKHQKRIQAALTSHSNVLGVELACDKERTKEILTSMGAPVPLGKVIYAFRDLEEAIDDLGGYPIVVKPLDGNQGRGITIDIRSWRQAEFAYDRAKDISDGVIVEHFYQGRDHRILVVNHKVVAVAERVPAHIVGNGQSTIFDLVELENKDARRGEGHDTPLTKIKLDNATDEMLSRQGFTLDTVLQPDQICYLRANANLSTGGTAIDRTDEIHPDTLWLAERASRIIDLDIVGIDVITTDITQPLKDVDGVIVEVNAAPGLRMHMAPSEGVARNVAAPILDMLFPAGAPTQIPVVAVAETGGSETPTPLISHILGQVKDSVGYTTADGAFIGQYPVKKGRATDAQSAQIILQDPTVDMAVLETSHSSILRSGLGFSHCDVGVVLNVPSDQSPCTLDHRARALSVISGAVHADGYAVLNADDERVVTMAEQVQGQVAYFSMDPENLVLRSHLQQGGIAAVYEQGYLSILQQDEVKRIEKVAHLPLTVRGCSPAAIASALAASLTAYVQGVTVEQIRAALQTYRSFDQKPSEPADFFDDDSQPNVPKRYINLKDVVLTTSKEPLPLLCDASAAQQVRELCQEYPAFRYAPSNPQLLVQVQKPTQLNGFKFWGTFTATDSLAVEPRASDAESRTEIVSEKEQQRKESAIAHENLDLESDLSTEDSQLSDQNDPTNLWVQFKNGLKPQTVLQNYISQASAVVAAPERTTVAPALAVSEELDSPEAQTNLEQKKSSLIRTQIETIQSEVSAAEKTAERARQELAALSEAIKQHDIKAWEAQQEVKIRRWTKEKAPVAKQVAEQVLDIGGTVVAISFVFTRIAAKMTFEMGRELGAIAREKPEKTVPSVDSNTLDPALKDVINILGKNGRFEGEVFIFQQTNRGVDVHLKNGTPVYTNRKLNPDVKTRFVHRLSKIHKRVVRVRADIEQKLTVQDYQKRLIEN